MANLGLVQNFMIQFLLPDAKLTTANILNSMSTFPRENLSNSLMHVRNAHLLNAKTREEQVAVTNGVLTGFMLGYLVEKNPEVAKMLQDYLDSESKRRGENVVELFSTKRRGYLNGETS